MFTYKVLHNLNTYIGIITISGGGDSYYEYLLKNYLLMGSTDDSLLSSWKTFVDSAETYLSQEDEFHNFTYLAELKADKSISQSGELV
jgi:mannosyl-oligosaccharide alpha-1,2-mannosidase